MNMGHKLKKQSKKQYRRLSLWKKAAKKPWIVDQALNLAHKTQKSKQIKHLSTEHIKRFKDICAKVKKSARQNKENWIQEQCEEVEKGSQVGNSKQAYRLVKMLKAKYVPKLAVMRNKDGTMLQ
jgi:hypothetical protein